MRRFRCWRGRGGGFGGVMVRLIDPSGLLGGDSVWGRSGGEERLMMVRLSSGYNIESHTGHVLVRDPDGQRR